MTASAQTGTTASPAYAPPRVTVRPPSEHWTDYPTPRVPDGGIVRVVLNVHTGALYAVPAPVGATTRGPYYDPDQDLWHRAWGYDRTPTRLAWDVRLNWPWTQSATDAADYLTRIVPTAQHLVDHLAPIPGAGSAWDWTPAATAAESRIRAVISALQQAGADFCAVPLPDRGYGVVAVSEVLETVPELVDPAWATMGDADLDRVAAAWLRPRFLSPRVEQALRDRFHAGVGGPIHLVRGRVDLREWRRRADRSDQ